MEQNQNHIRKVLNRHSLIPVVSFTDKDDPIEFVNYLIENGIHCIEVTLRTDYAWKAIELIQRNSFQNFDLGVGTVVSASQIKKLEDLNVEFIVSPGTTTKLIEELNKTNIPYITGVSTPTEIMNAQTLNLDTLKFFPANLFGGLKALNNYLALFPNVKFCPTGGISQDTYQNYLDLENVIAVGGSWLQSEFKTSFNK